MTGKTLLVKERLTIGDLKKRIQRLDGTPAHLQQFICDDGNKMEDWEDLSHCVPDIIHLRWKRGE